MSPGRDSPGLRVAYLVNQYPKVSHSFIRREINALERLGCKVERYAHRGWDAELVDQADQHERGLTRYLLRRRLVSLLFDVSVVAATQPCRFIRTLALVAKLARGSGEGLLRYLAYFVLACTLRRDLLQMGVSHVHAHFGTNSSTVALLTRLLGGPKYSFTVHGPEEFDKPESLHLRTKIRLASFVVAISSFGKGQLYRWIPHTDWQKVHVVPCGLEPEFFKAQQFHQGLCSRRLVCVGRICEQKGQLLLLEAARRLVDKGVEFELVLGGDGEMRAAVERRVAELGLVGKVWITGWMSSEQVREQLIAARSLILPSFAEGLPVVIMEAMAVGRPVISTFVAGIPELVIDGKTGWLVPAGDIHALALAMEDCLTSSQETLARMGEFATNRVRMKHDVAASAHRLHKLIIET